MKYIHSPYHVPQVQNLSKKAREMQLKVALADLVVVDVPVTDEQAGATDHFRCATREGSSMAHDSGVDAVDYSEITWGVQFVDGDSSPLVADDGVEIYDEQAQALITAAAAQASRIILTF